MASTSRIVVVGSGVVGQATGKGFAKKGHQVTFVDINPQTIAKLRDQGLRAMMPAEVDYSEVDVVMLAVPTPSVDDRIKLDYIDAAAAQVGRGLRDIDNYVTVVVRSTVPPGTTEQRVIPIIEETSGKQNGIHFGAGMNPEFLRAVSNEQDFARPWITVLGTADLKTQSILTKLYEPFGALIVHCTPTAAETIKYINNIYNAVKISYFNEVHDICKRLGVDGNLVAATVARSAESMWNPLYGTRGGVPYGGACLPKDTTAFIAFCRDYGWDHLMLDATIEVNNRLLRQIPAATSPDKIDQVLDAVKLDIGEPAREMAMQLGGETVVL